MPDGVHAVRPEFLDLRPDNEIDHDLLNPKPVRDEKNVWFFWHSGYPSMHPYTKRNIRAWHRRFSSQGWIIRVLDRSPSSPLNVANFLDIEDPETFPKAFIDGTLGGTFGVQHTSDLVRFPLLLKYGGIYSDVGFMQIGDVGRIWRETVGDPASPWEVLSYNCGPSEEHALANYFLMSRPNNPLFLRCHKLLLALWNADGGKTTTDGMHKSPLLNNMPLMGECETFTMEENGRTLGTLEVRKRLTDYIMQGQVMTLVMGLVDDEDNWDGLKYSSEHVFAIEYMEGSQLINDLTSWDGKKAFELMCLFLPKEGEVESSEQRQAREIVEACLQRSFGFKLAHGLILKVLGETLGSLWRANEGSDDVPGTYAHWLRYGMIYWCQDELPTRLKFTATEPLKRGPLLREK